MKQAIQFVVVCLALVVTMGGQVQAAVEEITVPEPSTVAGLVGIAAVSLIAYGWNRRRK